ncbi:MAG: hypothetical protein A3F70_14285 [Acidobacteria bacterium RIFCSPLOWO2_12_FULL_67_14]|nr:MAG: hypothetical protein A3F70_14285 [Acidobacteria bacterium RIFCSPLOWO2_12_FULL_67_14]
MLLVHNGSHDQPAPLEPTLPGKDARGAKHRGKASLHVLRAAAVEPAVTTDRTKRPVHAVDPDGVEMTAEHQRRPWRPALQHPDDVGAAGRDLDNLDGKAGGNALGRDPPGDVSLPP